MKLSEYLLEIKTFLQKFLQESHQKTYVLGLSGGIDSSLVAALTKEAVGKDKLMCLMIPIESDPRDLRDALLLVRKFKIKYLIIDGSESFHSTVKRFEEQSITLSQEAQSNLKVRIRMTILYAYAQTYQGLVLGTDNLDERYTGYFTKYGDGAADVLPIVYLNKKEVKEAAQLLGVPTSLIDKVPSAGLFQGQTDEKEMGITYDELDNYLLGKDVSNKAKKRIEELHFLSRHKREAIPTPIEFKRD